MSRIARMASALLLSYAAGCVGFLFVDGVSSAWYDALAKPSFTPPYSVFIVVWFVLYTFMGLALGIVLLKQPKTRAIEGWVACFLVQLACNAAWPIFFFGLHALFTAFADAVLLSILLLVVFFGAWEIDKRAGVLLLPYLLWILFADVLNLMIWYMN